MKKEKNNSFDEPSYYSVIGKNLHYLLVAGIYSKNIRVQSYAI